MKADVPYKTRHYTAHTCKHTGTSIYILKTWVGNNPNTQREMFTVSVKLFKMRGLERGHSS